MSRSSPSRVPESARERGKSEASWASGAPQDQYWNAAAAGWARWWELYERAAQPVSDRLVALAGIEAGQVVLDVATGLGEPALTAARLVGAHGHVVATDCSPAMLREAAVRARQSGLSRIEFREMDAQAPGLPDCSFDAILCRWGLMFIPDLEASLRRLLALLRPGGCFAAAVWGCPREVPFIELASSALAAHAPLPESSQASTTTFRFADKRLLPDVMRRAGFVDVVEEEVTLTFEFASAETYARFRRDMTAMDAVLAAYHPPEVIEAAWQAVTEAARAHAAVDGRVLFVNTTRCLSARRWDPSRRAGHGSPTTSAGQAPRSLCDDLSPIDEELARAA